MGEAVARGKWSVLLQHWHGVQKLSCQGQMPLWPDPFRVPLILTRESSCGRRPNGFSVPDLCPHNIGLPSPQLERSWKARPSAIQTAATGESGAFGTQQRVTLARVPQFLPQHLPVLRGSLWKRRSEDVGEETPSSLYRSPKMSWSRRGLEENFQTWDRMRRK